MTPVVLGSLSAAFALSRAWDRPVAGAFALAALGANLLAVWWLL